MSARPRVPEKWSVTIDGQRRAGRCYALGGVIAPLAATCAAVFGKSWCESERTMSIARSRGSRRGTPGVTIEVGTIVALRGTASDLLLTAFGRVGIDAVDVDRFRTVLARTPGVARR